MGFAVPNAYHAGTYKPGDELKFQQYRTLDDRELDNFCQRILTDCVSHVQAKNLAAKKEKTFAEIYELFYEHKYGEHAPKITPGT